MKWIIKLDGEKVCELPESLNKKSSIIGIYMFNEAYNWTSFEIQKED